SGTANGAPRSCAIPGITAPAGAQHERAGASSTSDDAAGASGAGDRRGEPQNPGGDREGTGHGARLYRRIQVSVQRTDADAHPRTAGARTSPGRTLAVPPLQLS